MKNLAFLVLALLFAQFSQAKNLETINITGNFVVIDGDLEESSLQLRNEDGAVKELRIKSNGKFSFEAFKDQNYILTFAKRGYVNKEILIDTHGEGDFLMDEIEFAVKLFPQASDSAQIVYNQPVGLIKVGNGTELVVEYNYTAALLPTRVEL